jgi:hypothetical protein
MAKPFFSLSAITLAAGLAVAGVGSTQAAPAFIPAPASVPSDVVQAQVDAKVVRRDRFHRDRDGGAWKERRHHHHEGRGKARRHDGRASLYRPKTTPKFAYDADGSLRIYDRDRRWKHDGGDDWDGRDWRKKRQKQPRIYRMDSLSRQDLSPGLRGILTTVPD